ncbi:MAG: PepSY-like domain-containing protein [Bacteroidetes bacterium]|nr:PepSY-like domain-containing protein [Bacteroidota bacterium]
MKIKFLILCLVLISVSSIAQDVIDEATIPAAVTNALKKRYSDVKRSEWFKNKDHFVCNFVSEEQAFVAEFTPEGAWVSTSSIISVKDAPGFIINLVKTDYKDFKIKEVQSVKKSTGENFYLATIKKEGVNQPSTDLYFDLGGKLTKKVDQDEKKINKEIAVNEDKVVKNKKEEKITKDKKDENSDVMEVKTGKIEVAKNEGDVPPAVLSNFKAKYPDATKITWKKETENFVATFILDEVSTTAEYLASGDWVVTKSRNSASDIPGFIISYIRTNYKEFKIKLIELNKKSNGEIFYYIQVKREGANQPITELFFTLSGTFIKKIDPEDKKIDKDIEIGEETNNDGEIQQGSVSPKELPSPIYTYLKEKYPLYKIKDAQILKDEDNKSFYKATIKKDGDKKTLDLNFDLSGKFLKLD